MLGRLHYRTSYGQNVLRHSLEVAYLSQTSPTNLKLDGGTRPPRRACCMILGKAMDHDQEGGYPAAGHGILAEV